MYKFTAWLWSIKKDKDGEVTLVLKVPQSEAWALFELPTETNFDVTMDADEKGEKNE